MRIVFVGETWMGSSARSLREALCANPSLYVDEIGEDLYFPKGRSLVVRGMNRLLYRWQRAELEAEIRSRLARMRPDVLMVYKGNGVTAETVRNAKRAGAFTVNVFPDCSPHAHGGDLRDAIGEYDLVVSTKPFHPAGWEGVYGYRNECVFVPHGYDPSVHFWREMPNVDAQDFDVVMVSGWRPQYHDLLLRLARHPVGQRLRAGIAGPGWLARARVFPRSWRFAEAVHGKAYGEFVRRGKIVIAPVNREVVISGKPQPGDEDTTRTYELAAAGCFFLHRRTAYVRTIYDEQSEVPMWDDAEELAELIGKYLPIESRRREMAARAHARAVPAYSIPSRATEIAEIVRNRIVAGRPYRPDAQ